MQGEKSSTFYVQGLDLGPSRFPFIAKENLQNEEMTEEYLKTLESRMNSCSESLMELNGQITEMLGV